jgi:hypothetical protein
LIKPKLPPMPIVAVHTRDQTDTINIVKAVLFKISPI